MHLKSTLAAAVLALGCTAANALELDGAISNDYLDLNVRQSILLGLEVNGGILNNFDDENTQYNVGLGYHIPLGVAALTLGSKLNWYAMNHTPNEASLSFGGDLSIPLGKRLSLFGSAYYAPWASGDMESTFDGRLGARVMLVKSLYLDAGYRYSRVKYDSGYQHDLADGFYGGIAFRF